MFYSHEILTNRSHGVATVWLVATLGSKSNLRRVTRKAILDVDVPKACETITNAENPLALRLQGSLLYGVARVYSQQCGYVLSDVLSIREKMNSLKHDLRDLDIDIEAGKDRSDNLNVGVDNAFLPELDINFDLSAFGESSFISESSCLTPRSLRSSHSSIDHQSLNILQQDGYSHNSSDLGGEGFQFMSQPNSRPEQPETHKDVTLQEDESAIDANPDFEIAADGSIHAINPAVMTLAIRTPAALHESEAGRRAETESVISAQVRDEHQAGLLAQTDDQPYLNDDGPLFDDSGDLTGTPVVEDNANQSQAVSPQREILSENEGEIEVVAASAIAPQRNGRKRKALEFDHEAVISSKALRDQERNYSTNMRMAKKLKLQKSAARLAKINAAYWMLTQGIGGIGRLYDGSVRPHPLSVLTGEPFIAGFRGLSLSSPSPSSRKRLRYENEDDEESDEDAARRTRARLEVEDDEAEGPNKQGEFITHDDEDGIIGGDEENVESEAGRRAPSSVPDHPSGGMPWNIMGSRHSSQRHGGLQHSGGLAGSSSAGGCGTQPLGPFSGAIRSRRPSRAPSASPLQGRGLMLPRYSALSLRPSMGPSGYGSDSGEVGSFGDFDLNVAGGIDLDPEEEFQLFGPGIDVPTQTAAQSQWVTKTLEQESRNFLEFVRTALAEAEQNAVDEEDGENIDYEVASGTSARSAFRSITMNTLLPPANNSKVVGAQGLLHILTLATKGDIEVEQEEAFRDIAIRLSKKNTRANSRRVEDDEHGDGSQSEHDETQEEAGAAIEDEQVNEGN